MKFNILSISVVVLLVHQVCADDATPSSTSASSVASVSVDTATPATATASSANAASSIINAINDSLPNLLNPPNPQPQEQQPPQVDEQPQEVEDNEEEDDDDEIATDLPDSASVNKLVNLVVEDHLTNDLMDGGWSQNQANMVISLIDALDGMADSPQADDSADAEAINNLRNEAHGRLLDAGYAFKTMAGGDNRRVLTRVMTRPNTGYRKQGASDLVRSMMDLVQAAARYGPLFTNTAFGQYAGIITSAARMMETLLHPRNNMNMNANAPPSVPRNPRVSHH